MVVQSKCDDEGGALKRVTINSSFQRLIDMHIIETNRYAYYRTFENV